VVLSIGFGITGTEVSVALPSEIPTLGLTEGTAEGLRVSRLKFKAVKSSVIGVLPPFGAMKAWGWVVEPRTGAAGGLDETDSG
jgi:hypothetical protein